LESQEATLNGYKTWIVVVAGILLIGGALPALADTPETEADERIDTEASVSVGYRGTSVEDAPSRAREYDSLESSPLFNVKIFTDQGGYHLDLGADYLNEDDYKSEFHLDTKGLLRLDLRSERFFHNLDHIPYDNGYSGVPIDDSTMRTQTSSPVEGSRPEGWFENSAAGQELRAYYTDQNPGDQYGLRLDTNEAKLRIKCPDYPAHINLSYWRYEKKGEKQLRFVSEGGIPGTYDQSTQCVGCHMQSKTRDIDRVTEEFKVNADAHAGFVDVVLETLYRTFHDREAIPVDEFGAHGRGRNSGDYEHSEEPDSQVKEATLRLNSAPSGGLVGSASFTIGERENRSDLSSVAPVKAETDYTKSAADVTYTPGQRWTFNMRYRLLDMDSDNSDVITQYGSERPGDLEVRESMDIKRAWYEALVSYRPTPRLTLKAEFRREDIDRSNTGPEEHVFHSEAVPAEIEINESWQLPDEEIITRVKLGFTSRLLEKSTLKLSGWLALQRNDDPAYGTSFENSQELFLSAGYNPSPIWGLLANLNLLKQDNNGFEVEGFSTEISPYQFSKTFDLEREKEQQNISLGTWLTPRDGLSFDLNYGYMRTAIEQDLLFGKVTATPEPDNTDFTIEDENVDYRQTVQTVILGMTWQALKNLSCRFEGYHIRSKASYDPEFGPYSYALNGADADSSDLREISEVDIRQNGLRGRINWQVTETVQCGVEATFDDYDEVNNDVFDGSVQTYLADLSYVW
jgi:hypothetical protein